MRANGNLCSPARAVKHAAIGSPGDHCALHFAACGLSGLWQSISGIAVWRCSSVSRCAALFGTCVIAALAPTAADAMDLSALQAELLAKREALLSELGMAVDTAYSAADAISRAAAKYQLGCRILFRWQ